jgi:hypothetical protein
MSVALLLEMSAEATRNPQIAALLAPTVSRDPNSRRGSRGTATAAAWA